MISLGLWEVDRQPNRSVMDPSGCTVPYSRYVDGSIVDVSRRALSFPLLGGDTADGGTTLAEQAYKLLRSEIVICRLAPGALVSAGQLKLQYGLGASPTREALARLASEGLVYPLARSGYRITPVTLGDVDQLFEAWIVVEPAIARLAAQRIDNTALARLRTAVERTDADDDEIMPGLNAAVRMWDIIAPAAQNEYLRGLFKRLQSQQIRLWYLVSREADFTKLPSMEAGILALVEALEARDVNEVNALTSAFIHKAHDEVMRMAREWPSVRAAELTKRWS